MMARPIGSTNRNRWLKARWRFLEQTDVKGPGECWMWIGARTGRPPRQYGQIGVAGEVMRAHRFSYVMHFGEIGGIDLEVCHSCDTPLCVNPCHLFLGTHQDNMTDKKLKGRASRLAGERNPSALLTAARVREARERHAAGETQTSIARCFGVSLSTVHLIVKGKIWKETH